MQCACTLLSGLPSRHGLAVSDVKIFGVIFQVEAVLQAADLSVLMPGQRYPTYLAQPAPLPPSCPREGVHWPPHDYHGSYMPP